jgi:hypothetical protein
MPTTNERDKNRLPGWAALVGVAAVTAALMFGASSIGLAKSPTAATLEEEDGSSSAENAPAGPSSATVDVTLTEWSIEPSVTSVEAGVITFNVHNAGPNERHECIILKTDIPPESLPTLDDNSLDEEGDGITSPGESHVLKVGDDQEVKVEMTPGDYVFVDNVVEDGTVHWEKKAYATFTVEPGGETATP